MPKWLREVFNSALWSTVIAAAITLATWMFASQISVRRLVIMFGISWVYSFLTSSIFHLGTQLTWPYTTRFKPAETVAIRALLFFVFATISSILAAAMIAPALNIPFKDIFWNGYKVTLLVSYSFGGMMAAHEGVKHTLAATQLKLKERELDHERALKAATEAQLASLESRIHPHFLFNALNSISSLIPEDPKRAERLLGQMSTLLRFSLDSPQVGLVPLERELRIVEDYLEIEKARFEQRLRYDIQLSGNLTGVQVPPLSIQTLVENSIKHAVGPSRAGASIRVSAEGLPDRVTFKVSDDGPGFDLSSLTASHGLDNLTRRLEVLFEGKALLEVQRGDDGFTHAGFTVPRSTAPATGRNSAA